MQDAENIDLMVISTLREQSGEIADLYAKAMDHR